MTVQRSNVVLIILVVVLVLALVITIAAILYYRPTVEFTPIWEAEPRKA